MAAFTAIATGIGLAATAATTGMSFAQASKQNKLQKEAEAKAAEAMAEARKKLEVNFAENLSIQKEPYELEREALLSQGALALQAGIESDRGAETTAGRLQMAQNAAQAGIRSAMGQDLMGIQQQIINEESRLRDKALGLDLGEVEGAQLAARDAEEARAQAMSEGFQGLTSLGQQVSNLVPLYQKTAEARNMEKLNLEAQPIIQRQNFQQKIDMDAAKSLAALESAQYQRNMSTLNKNMEQLYSGLGFK
jgi:hypothetical protein